MNLEDVKEKAVEFSASVKSKEALETKDGYVRGFMSIFGIKGGIPEHPIMVKGFQVYVDYVLPGRIMMVNTKKDESFDECHKRGLVYIDNQYVKDRPQILILTDKFETVRIYDMSSDNVFEEFKIEDLKDHLTMFEKVF